MNQFKVKNPRKNLLYEIAFTKAYRDALRSFHTPEEIELACLRAQFPAALHPIQEEDLIAGRLQMGLVGLGIQGQTGGFGYYMDEDRVVLELERGEGGVKYREDLHDMLTFWKGRNTTDVVLRGIPSDIKEALPHALWKTQPLAASPIIRMAGAYIDYYKLLKTGLPGLEAEVKAAREKADSKTIYDCMLGELELVREVCRFYAKMASEQMTSASDERKAELQDMAAALEHICVAAPSTMLEGLQLAWLYGLLVPLLQHGRIDEYIGDLYVKDIDSGKLSDEKALAYLQSYYRLVDHMDSETDGRVIVGGYGRRNPENADRVVPLCIEACRTVREPLPQFTLRFNRETPENIKLAAMRCIEEGRTYPLLYNDDVLVPALMKAFGVDRDRAETYVPLGCGEFEFDHCSFGSPNGSANTLKMLELAIRGGYDPMTCQYMGPSVKPLVECSDFEEFWHNYTRVIDYYIEAQAKFEKYQYDITGTMHPFLLVSMLYDGCVQKGRAILGGGCEFLTGALEFYGNVNAADSLTAIKKLVFEEKSVSPQELVRALDDNFYGHDTLRAKLMNAPKYGNDDDYADSVFVRLHDYVCGKALEQGSKVGLDRYLAVTINNAQNTTLARWVGATPDGRKSGTPMANANNPAPGRDKNGVTAMLNSILKPKHDSHAGMVQNMRFTRELFENSREKMYALIGSYFDRGGAQAMITVVGKDDLQNAMENPAEYKDLMVRVGGFSARFVDLKKDVQMEIYNRVTY